MSDRTVGHLREVADWPDLSGTRYEVREHIAQGGMGKVYRAVDRDLDRDVALKVLHVPRLDDSARARMLREARILARLEHPGIVPVHDVGQLPDGRVYYTMKFVKGSRLDEHTRAHPDVVELLRVFERVCEAVAFAHAHGVIHRDLKPENVMVGAFGEVLVMDWGVAKILEEGEATEPGPAARPELGVEACTGGSPGDDDARTIGVDTSPMNASPTSPGTVLGTPGYMSPEQAAGQVDRIGRRADVYSLGVILDGLLGTTGGAIPKPLRAMIAKATAEQVDARYSTVEELAAEVRRYLSDRTVNAYRESPWERITRAAYRYRTPILLLLFYVVIRLLILVFAGT